MRFITTLILIYLCWRLLAWIAGIAFRYWIRKNAGKVFTYSGGFGQKEASRPEGEIRVEQTGNPSPQPKIRPDDGEYVDYEEVK